jgi:hypothetical protein
MQLYHTLVVHAPKLSSNILLCTYSMGDEHFTTSYRLPDGEYVSDALTEKLCQWLAIVSSFSCFSTAYFDEIRCEFPLTHEDTAFFEKLFFHGFGEFRLRNNIDVAKKTRVCSILPLVAMQPVLIPKPQGDNGPLLLNGGGKDGSTSAYLLGHAQHSFTWFQRGNSVAQSNVVAVWDAPVIYVSRLLERTSTENIYSGHRPVNAALVFTALLTAKLGNYSAIIASNEASANEGNAIIDGFHVNHQYSKTFEFESDVNQLLTSFGVDIKYFSLLRPLDELQISFVATKLSNNQLAAITSCNRGTRTGIWCMSCAKCAFVALAITAADPAAAEKIWGDRTVINLPALQPHLVALLDPAVDKPFECVGTLTECQLAARLILARYDGILDMDTRKLFKRHTTNNITLEDKKNLVALGPSLVPPAYQDVLQTAQDILRSLVMTD